MSDKWRVDEDTVFFELDETYLFSIKRVEDGFSLKLYNQSGEKKTLLYTRFLSDSQIGYKFIKEQN